MKKLGLFVTAYFVLTMAWAYPWHLIWFHDVYVRMGAVTRPEPIIPFGMLAIILQGLVIGHLYPYYPKGEGSAIWSGIKFQMIVGVLIYSVMGFATAAKIQIEPVSQFLLYHTAFQFIQFLLTGTALGLIYSTKPTEREETRATG